MFYLAECVCRRELTDRAATASARVITAVHVIRSLVAVCVHQVSLETSVRTVARQVC